MLRYYKSVKGSCTGSIEDCLEAEASEGQANVYQFVKIEKGYQSEDAVEISYAGSSVAMKVRNAFVCQ